VLAALDAARLKLFATFGSIIARTGLPGEADYAAANEWLRALTDRFQDDHPQCRCVTLEWSVWSGVGMGQRLGRVELLAQQGITPIPPDEGVRLLSALLARRLPSARILVTGRFGALPTLAFEHTNTPFVRFLEQARVFYPGIEAYNSDGRVERILRAPYAGALVSIELKENSREAAFAFMDALELCVRSTSLGDVFTSVLHPATASHREVAPARRGERLEGGRSLRKRRSGPGRASFFAYTGGTHGAACR